jgi:ubiquinone/menaquinone biosynthesis C-methylase UbiE
MPEIDLMRYYPRRPGRASERPQITDADRRIAKQFGFDYFDGDRSRGYGGYSYHPRFWTDTVKYIRDHYRLEPGARILDVGCAKGFMLQDFLQLMPGAKLAGIDISEYAIEHSLETVKPLLRIGDARALPFPDKSFDLVISINTVHNLPYEGCKASLREIQRVSAQHSFIMVDAYRTAEQRQALLSWVLTAETMLSVDGWLRLFKEAGYTGDYYWWGVE